MNYYLKQVLGICLALTLMGETSCTKKEEPTKNKEKVEPKKKEEKPSKPEDKKPENSEKQDPNKPEDKKPENSGKQDPNKPEDKKPENSGKQDPNKPNTPAEKPSNGSTTPKVTPTPNKPNTGNNSEATTEPKKPENTNPAPDKKENNNSSNGNTTPSIPKVTPPAPNNNGNTGSGSSTNKPADKPSNGSTTPKITPTPNNPNTGNNSGSTTEPKNPENTNPAPGKKENNNSSNDNTIPSTPKVTPPAPHNNGNSGSSAGGGSRPNTPQGDAPKPLKPAVYRDKSLPPFYQEQEMQKEEENRLLRFDLEGETTAGTNISTSVGANQGKAVLLLSSGTTTTMHLEYKGNLEPGTYHGATFSYRSPKQTRLNAGCSLMITKKDANTIWGFFYGTDQTKGIFRGYFCVPLSRK